MEGFLGGWMEGKQFQQKQAAGALELQKLGLDVQEAKDKIELHDQQMKMFAQQTSAGNQQFGGVPMDAKDTLMTWANIKSATGEPVEAANILDKLATVEKDSSDIEIARSNQAEKSLGQAIQGLQSVNDDAGWKQYWNDYFTAHPRVYENPQVAMQLHQIAQLPFTPERKQTFLDQYTTQLQTAQIRRTQAETDLARSRTEYEDFRREKLLPAQVDATEARADHLRKLGLGAGANAPLKSEDVKAATDLIGSVYNTASNPAAARNVARVVARRALQLQADEGISPDAARQRALDEARFQGRLAGFKPGRAGQGSFEKPVVPTSNTFAAGTWYVGAPGSPRAGEKFFYDGKKFVTKEEMATRMGSDLGEETGETTPDNEGEE